MSEGNFIFCTTKQINSSLPTYAKLVVIEDGFYNGNDKGNLAYKYQGGSYRGKLRSIRKKLRRMDIQFHECKSTITDPFDNKEGKTRAFYFDKKHLSDVIHRFNLTSTPNHPL